jgi:type IV pilus assembly protein PilY1
VGDTTTPSNLGRISAWVDSGLSDNTIRRIYGGDMLGNLWRFDINDTYGAAGRDAFKMATLRVGTTRQPITAKPELGLIDYGTTKGTVPVIYVGTGRYVGSPDVTDLSLQTIYAIRDKLDSTYLDNPRALSHASNTPDATNCMVEQKLASLDSQTRVISTNYNVDLSAQDCGFLIDLKDPANTTPGERVNVDMKLQLGVLGVITNIPENSICTVGGSSFIYFLDFAKGGTLGNFQEITDVNNVPSTSASNKVGERVGNSTAVGMNTYRLPDGRVVTTVTTADDKHPVYGNPTYTGGAVTAKRVLWRELLN